MKFTLKQLLVFETVAEMGTVSTAAAALKISQSAASMSLQQLEQLLEHPLFERQGRRLVLNARGTWLRPKARQLIQIAREIELGFAGQHVISGELHLAASQTIAEQMVPDLISRLDSQFPQLVLPLEVANTEQVIYGVKHFQYDLGLVEGRCDDHSLHQQRWCTDELVLLAAAHHPYAKAQERGQLVSLSQLEQAQWVLRERGAGTRDVFDSTIHGKLGSLDVWREYSHVPALISLVKNGQYLTCLSKRIAEPFIQQGELVILEQPELKMQRHLSFVWRREEQQSPLRDVVLREAQRL